MTIPIRLYNAVDSAESVSFNLLHKKDSGRIGYEKKCKKCGKVVVGERRVRAGQVPSVDTKPNLGHDLGKRCP